MGGRIKTDVKLGGLEREINGLCKIDNLIFLGCGTSFNAAHFASYYFKQFCNFNIVMVYDGADFCQNDIPNVGKSACIFLSQSGETQDLIRCLSICKQCDVMTIGVVNVVDSHIARETDCGCYINAGREVGVASTKSFTSQSIVLLLICIWFSKLHFKTNQNQNQNQNTNQKQKQNDSCNLFHSIKQIHISVENTLELSRELMKKWCQKLRTKKSIFILGKDECYSIAREAALKIKEISYIHAEDYPASSLKHGPFGLLEKGFPVILIDIGDKNRNKMENVYNEIKCRGAEIFTVTDKPSMMDERENVLVLNMESTLNSLVAIIPLQFLSFYLSISKNINPDYPRNLAKVVTVE